MSVPALQAFRCRNGNHQVLEVDSNIITKLNKDRRPSAMFKTEVAPLRPPTKSPLLDAGNDAASKVAAPTALNENGRQQQEGAPEKPGVVQRTSSKEGVYARRKSSVRKSVHGLVIELDLEDEDEVNTYALCDDYEDDIRRPMQREESNGSLEELRTRLEALEHERNGKQLPEHDDYGWGQDCVNKKMLEALEGHQSMTSATYFLGDSEEEEDKEAESPLVFRRRSTARSSIINGLVLEYDFSDSEEEDEDDHDEGTDIRKTQE